MPTDYFVQNSIDRLKIFERFFTHPRLNRATTFSKSNEIKRHVIAVDFAQAKDGQLRMCFYVKNKELDRVFRSVEEVFEGWDGYYSFTLPEETEITEIQSIKKGIERIFDGLATLAQDRDDYWFIVKDVDEFYCFG